MGIKSCVCKGWFTNSTFEFAHVAMGIKSLIWKGWFTTILHLALNMFLQCRLGFITLLFCCSLGTIALRISKNKHLFSSAFRRKEKVEDFFKDSLTQLRFDLFSCHYHVGPSEMFPPKVLYESLAKGCSMCSASWLHMASYGFIASWAEILGRPEHGKNQAEYVCQAGTRLSGANWDVKFADHLPIFRVKPNAYVDPDSLFQHSESNSPPCIWIRQRVNAWSASCTRPKSWRRWQSKPSLVWKLVSTFFSRCFFSFFGIFDNLRSKRLSVWGNQDRPAAENSWGEARGQRREENKDDMLKMHVKIEATSCFGLIGTQPEWVDKRH